MPFGQQTPLPVSQKIWIPIKAIIEVREDFYATVPKKPEKKSKGPKKKPLPSKVLGGLVKRKKVMEKVD
jgi:hypothetical protein